MPNSKNITFDQLQSALTRVKNSLDKKANTSHGNHVPKTETANNARFLRNDNTWQTITPVNIGAADRSHNHTSLTGVTSLQFAAASSDHAAIKVTTDGGSAANTYLDFEMDDDSNTDMFRWRFNAWDADASAATGQFNLMTLTAKDTTSARLTVNGDVTASSFTGNASSATKLQTARALKIGNTSKNFDGTGNITWTLSEIGAAASSHGTHVTYATAVPLADGTAAVGTSSKVAREDHVHPIQTTVTGNAGTATKLQTARTLTIGNKGKAFDGSANVTWTLSEIGAAATGHTHNKISSRGKVAAETTTTRPAVDGISMTEVYDNGYPTTYGNVITLKGQGDGQILVGWSGSSGGHAPVYVRSKRDTTDANWSGWAQFYTSANPQTSVSGNAGTATKLQTARTLTIGNTGKNFDGSGNVSWNLSEIGAASSGHTHASIRGTAGGSWASATVNAIDDCVFQFAAHINKSATGIFATSNNANAIISFNRHEGNYASQLGFNNSGDIFYRSADGSALADGTAWKQIAFTSSSISGNAASATKLQNARNIKIGNTSRSFNGTADVKWTLEDIGAAASSHGHSYLPLSGGTITGEVTLNNYLSLNAWSGYGSGKAQIWYNGTAKELTIQPTAVTNIRVNNNTVLHAGNYKTYATPANIGAAPSSHGTHVTWSTTTPKANGTAAVGTEAKVARGDHVHPLQTTVSGNAGTATKLATARAIKIGNTSRNFDGSANVTWTLGDIGAAASSHGHSNMLTFKSNHAGDWTDATSMEGKVYMGGWHGNITDSSKTKGYISLALNSGAALDIHLDGDYYANENNLVLNTGNYKTHVTPANIGAAKASHGTHVTYGGNGSATTVSRSDHTHSYIPLGGSASITGNLEFSNSGTTTRGVMGAMGDNDYWRIVGGATASNSGYLEIATADDANEPIYVRQYGSGKFGTLTRTATLLDASGNTSFPGTVTAPTFSGTLTGNATSANLLLSTADRPESANTPVVAGPSIALMLATSTMKTGKPITDGYITEYRWDTSGGWSSQLFVPNGNKPMQFRYMNSGTWQDWYTIYSSNNPQTTITGNAGSATKLKNARTLTIGNTGKSFNGTGNVSWSLSEIGAASSGHTHTNIKYQDKRSENTTPANISEGVSLHLKARATAGLDDGGDYYASLFLKPWNDHSGGPYANIAVTGNQNIWLRTSSSDTAWNSWKQIAFTSSSITGNAASATKLQNARTINGTSFNGTANITTANWGTARTLTIGSSGKSVNGSANVSWTLSDIGAAAANHSHSNYAASSHEHNYLNVKGTNTIGSVNDDTTANWGAQGNSVHWYAGTEGLLHDQPSSWGYLVNIGQSSEVHQIWMTQASGDLLHRGGNGSGWSGTWRTILDSSNYNTYAAAKSHTHDYAASNHTHNYAGSSSAGGNANAAVKLATARSINGTNFDGSGNITTANWGTARTITIGGTGKSVNGSGNVSWSLSEIGALPTAGGTVSGNLNVTGAFSIGGKKITINSSAPSSPAVGDIWIKI